MIRRLLRLVDPIGEGDRQFREWCRLQKAPGWPLRFHLFRCPWRTR